MRRRFGLVAAATLVAACAGGSGTGPLGGGAPFPRLASVAVAPFENLSGYRKAGAIVADQAAAALAALPIARVEGWASVDREASLLGVNPPIDRDQAARVGKALGVEGVLYGTVLVFGFEGLGPGRVEPSVSVAARLVRSSDGEILWAGLARGEGGGWIASRSEGLDERARSTVRDLLGVRAGG